MKFTDKLGLPIWNNPETDVFDIQHFNKGMQAIDDIIIKMVNQINGLVIGDTKVDLDEYVKKEILKEYVKKEVEKISLQLDTNVQQINGIKNPNYNEVKPYCIFIDDDGRIEFLTKLKPIFDKKGIKCNIAIQTSRVGSESKYLSWNEINELSREGYEISSHGHEHKKIGNITDKEALFELKESKRILNEKGYKARAFVYGDGCDYSDTRARELVKKYYECGIATQHGNSNIYPLDSFCMSRWSITRPLTELKTKVDLCESEKNVTIFMCHAWDTALTTEKLAEIEELIDYIKTKNIEIITLEQMLDKVGNVIEIGNPNTSMRYAVSKTGVTVSGRSAIPTFDYNVNNEFLEKSIDDFSSPSINIGRVSSKAIGTFPNGTNGNAIITVYKYSSSDYRFNYRTLQYVGSEIIWYQFLNSNNEWLEWKTQSSDVGNSNASTFSIYHRNGTNFEKPITEYEKGIIYESWSSSLSTTSPTKTKGTTIIYNIFNTPIYNYEEFIPCNANEKYMRKPSSDGLTWGEWIKI